MAIIQKLLEGKNDELDYKHLIENFPWITEENRFCVLSPDSDGLLCGLFMSWVRNWKVVGFYDDKVAVINSRYNPKDVVFLDGEIFREEAKSMGHHMVCLNNSKKNILEKNFQNCIQPNLMRNYDGKHYFRLKYPLATIHMLVSIIAYADKEKRPIQLDKEAIAPLFFTDGVFQILFKYPENVLNWLSFLRVHEDWNPLKQIFENDYSIYQTMKLMDDFFRKRDSISIKNERGDRLKISEKNGNPYNILGTSPNAIINTEAANRIKQFCEMMGQQTRWRFDEEKWICWNNLNFYKFSKSSFKGDNKTLTIKAFEDFILNTNPLSWAQTSTQDIEYTKEEPSKFFPSTPQ